jgi:hypothetical protein
MRLRLLLLALLAGCAGARPTPPSAAPPADEKGDGSPLADFGRALAADFTAGQDGLAGRFDLDALLDRSLQGLPAPEEFKRGFKEGLRKRGLPLGASVLQFLQGGGRLTFVKVSKNGGDPAVTLRALAASGGFNFMQFVVRDAGGGTLRVVDLYDIGRGNLVSEDLRRVALMALAEARQGSLDGLSGSDRGIIGNVRTFARMNEAQAAGRLADAYRIYETLPLELREERVFLRQSIMMAVKVDPATYRRQLDRFIQLFPQDPAAQVMAIDACFLREDWGCARGALDALERWLGEPDGWIEVLRGTVASSAKELAEARRHFERARLLEPGLPQATGSLLTVLLAQRDHAATARLLEELERRIGKPFPGVMDGAEFEGFRGSPEGKAFLAGRAR